MQIISKQQSQNIKQSQNFRGRLDKSVYRHANSIKRRIGEEALKWGNDYSDRFESVNNSIKILENFAKEMHPKSKIRLWNGRKTVYGSCFDGSPTARSRRVTEFFVYNKKLNYEHKMAEIQQIGAFTHPYKEFEHAVSESVRYITPKGQDTCAFYEKRSAKVDNKLKKTSFNFIEKLFLRHKAKKYDKLAPEFNGDADALKIVNDRFKDIDKVKSFI